MTESLNDRNLVQLSRLTSPRELREELPVSDAVANTVLTARDAVRDILHGRNASRLMVVVGPCSLHDRESALEYARKLAPLAESLPELLIVMRTYFEKPRTTVGWKGLINDPHLDGSGDVETGLRHARKLLLDINELGLPCASEVLDPVIPQYISDLLSWVAIGARTTESQTHREIASGLSMPVGFKNGTEGGLQMALDAMVSAASSHHFLGVDQLGSISLVETQGNQDRHVVLRGGRAGPNYSATHVEETAAKLREQDVPRGVLVDCSHDNSGKDPSKQGAVCRAVLDQVRAGQTALMGVMLESHLLDGKQDWQADPRIPGRSITDGCIGWEETEDLLGQAAEAVRGARSAAPGSPEGAAAPGPQAA